MLFTSSINKYIMVKWSLIQWTLKIIIITNVLNSMLVIPHSCTSPKCFHGFSSSSRPHQMLEGVRMSLCSESCLDFHHGYTSYTCMNVYRNTIYRLDIQGKLNIHICPCEYIVYMETKHIHVHGDTVYTYISTGSPPTHMYMVTPSMHSISWLLLQSIHVHGPWAMATKTYA